MSKVTYSWIAFDGGDCAEDGSEAFAQLVDILANDYELDCEQVSTALIMSGIIEEFERHPSSANRKLPEDLAASIASRIGRERAAYPDARPASTPEYWAGHAIARFQLQTGHPYARILRRIPLASVVDMHQQLHEASENDIIEELERLYTADDAPTQLSVIRKSRGITQSELSRRSGVTLRSIQMYEQRNKNINHASVESIYRLSRVLDVQIDDLMEL